jgi:hypothetical protein
MKFSILALAIMLVGCDNHEEPARQALREAEVACKLPEGMLQYLGSSDDPEPKYAPPDKPPSWVMTPDLGWSRKTTNECLADFTSSRGYRIEQPRTD